jgi:hypothetical protein
VGWKWCTDSFNEDDRHALRVGAFFTIAARPQGVSLFLAERRADSAQKHFAVAFFGYHLQGRDNYADCYSKRFVERRTDLAWGVYQR